MLSTNKSLSRSTRINLFLVLSSLFMGRCQEEYIPRSSCVLKEQITHYPAYPSDGIHYTYDYTGNKILVTLILKSNNSNDKSSYVWSLDNGGYVTQSDLGTTFKYDSIHRLIKHDWLNAEVFEFKYNNNSQLTIEKYYSNHSNTDSLKMRWYSVFEYDNPTTKNPLRQKSFRSDTLFNEVIYTYDNKRRPFDAKQYCIDLEDEWTVWFSENNILSMRENGGRQLINTYEYNVEGYPTKQKSTWDSGEIEITTYEYDCQH